MSKGNRGRRREKGLLAEPNRCIAHRKNGDRCKRPPINGGAVCPSHGGSAKQVRLKAQERLMAGILPLLAQLYHLATDETVPPAVRLAAIKDWLDRAGLNAKTTVELDLPWQQLLSGIVATVDPEMLKQGRQFYESGRPDGSSLTVLTEGVDYAVGPDGDSGYTGKPGLPAEQVDSGPAPQHAPDHPRVPHIGQPAEFSTHPRQRQARRGRR